MRKRLRKKRRLGEFAELGFLVVLRYRGDGEGSEDSLVDTFIEQAIEARGLSFGGGGGHGVVEGFVMANSGSATEADRKAARAWLAARPQVTSVDVQPLRDAHHGW